MTKKESTHWEKLAKCSPLLIALLVAQSFADGQAANAKASLQPQPMAREVMFRVLFREVANFQAKADEFAKQAKPDAFLREYHRGMLELNETQDTELKRVFIECAQQIHSVDAQAANIIDAVKSRYRHAPRNAASGLVPPPPQELHDLEAKRTTLVLSAADSLASNFGPAQSALFQARVRQYVGSHYRAVSSASVR
ncbi:MAG: hypothetical protein M3Y72_17335 [Acidobacteriota bacterium]|nr:hypothetical protein [Acidobacteriota bacterium]MDQ2842763.1 hypothetical protein [Acidobacteriota bacterium]